MLSKLFRLASVLVRLFFRNPRDVQHVLGIALHGALEIENPEGDARPIPAISVDDLAADSEEGTEICLHVFSGIPASVSALETYALALLIRIAKAKTAFEFGTYKGVSSTQIALNLAEPARLYTLDLPEDNSVTLHLIDKAEERQIAAEAAKGVLIPEVLRSRIIFVRQDSATLDSNFLTGEVDLVFVDAAHNFAYVKNDSEKGWQMLRSGGILVWHDCVSSHPDVVRFVKGCGWSPRRVIGTALAFAVKP